MPEAIRRQLEIKNETIFFEELDKKELELVKAGEACVHATIQELAASGHGYALKCCSDFSCDSFSCCIAFCSYSFTC